MNKHFHLITILIILLAGSTAVYSQTSNDHIFPAAAVAKPYIDFDSKGFIIQGKRTFVVSAGLEYARIPRQLWYDRLLRVKRAGFNCVEIYTFWNFHEEQEGKFDFTGDHDLGAFLTIVKNLGMYAIVRVGPYYCAEWDNGGYPLWLKFKKDLSVREDNKVFERYVDRFFDHLLPVVFKNQVNKGGPVIMVQLENEHTKGWGTAVPDGYFSHLQAKALSLGLQVPYFFSGLHHSSDPAENGKLDDPARPNPWFSTEFWSVWYSQYGARPGDAGEYDRRTWKIIAHGGNGYNYYMAHGGSNFGYTNNDEDAASYDYGAAIGQAGDLRPIYYTFKRAASFARSFQDILENSTDATASFSKIVSDTSLKVNARTSPAGDIIFLDNPGSATISTKLPGIGATVAVAPGKIYPLIHNFQIAPGCKLDWAYTRIFALIKQQNTTTIIVDAEPDVPVSLHFFTQAPATALQQSPVLNINKDRVDLEGLVAITDKPLEFVFKVNAQIVRVLVMNRNLTDKTWIADTDKGSYIICGTNYAGKVVVKDRNIEIETEAPLSADTQGPVWLYTGNKTELLKNNPRLIKQPSTLALSKWEFKNASTPAGVNYNTINWLRTKIPVQMGADGDLTADAWYRTKLDIPTDGKYTLQLKGNGRGQAYIDGKPAEKWELKDGEVLLDLKKGKHTLAIFTAHDGRDKLAGYIGPIENVDSKGLFDTVRIKKGGPFISELKNWYFTKAERKEDVNHAAPEFDTTLYKKYKIGTDVFNQREGFGWFQTTIPELPAGTAKLKLSFKSVDENATVFINGKRVSHHDGWNIPFEVNVTDQAVFKGPVTVTLFIENYSNEGGIDQPVRMNIIGDAPTVTGWAMKGGTGSPRDIKDWQVITGKNSLKPGPNFYRVKFNALIIKGQTFIWRVDPKGLGHGSVWVNGHNLGRYPEKIAGLGIYIPECWLKNGSNELIIFDEDGRIPDAVRVIAEPQAGRIISKLTGPIN